MAHNSNAAELSSSLDQKSPLPDASNDHADNKTPSVKGGAGKDSGHLQGEYPSDSSSSDSVKEVFDIGRIDPVLAKKLALVNQAIDDIGMTGFQWKLFFFNGFGYAVDSVSLHLCPWDNLFQRKCG
jgi:hypothetical protein